MDNVHYAALVRACDSLLLSPDAPLERIAVPWLHVQNEHPAILSRYVDLFNPPTAATLTRNRLRRTAGLARPLLKAGLDAMPAPMQTAAKAPFPASVDVLFISHLVSARMGQSDPDFYYGQLPHELAKAGMSSLLALMVQIPKAPRSLRARFTTGGVTSRVVLPSSLSLSREAMLLWRARRAARDLMERASTETDSFARTVALEASRYAMTSWTVQTLRMHEAVRDLCARFRPRTVIVLWEGHAWERMAFHAARCVDPGIRCIAYQHTFLFPRAHAVKRLLGAGFDPDAVMTIGEVTATQLAESLRGQDIPVVVYGSHRRQIVDRHRSADASKYCLVIPDGVESECVKLFEFAVAAASRTPDLKFIFRTHPVMPFQELAQRHVSLRHLPPNVRVSAEKDISKDFAQCAWALYRTSSAAVYAVLAGVRPVYLQSDGELPIDPLFPLQVWRRHVGTVEAFGALIDQDRRASAETRVHEWATASAFCEKYVVAPRPDVVNQLLQPA